MGQIYGNDSEPARLQIAEGRDAFLSQQPSPHSLQLGTAVEAAATQEGNVSPDDGNAQPGHPVEQCGPVDFGDLATQFVARVVGGDQ